MGFCWSRRKKSGMSLVLSLLWENWEILWLHWRCGKSSSTLGQSWENRNGDKIYNFSFFSDKVLHYTNLRYTRWRQQYTEQQFSDLEKKYKVPLGPIDEGNRINVSFQSSNCLKKSKLRVVTPEFGNSVCTSLEWEIFWMMKSWNVQV